jgi:hypothetical protein
MLQIGVANEWAAKLDAGTPEEKGIRFSNSNTQLFAGAGATIALLFESPDRYDVVTRALNDGLDLSFKRDLISCLPQPDATCIRYLNIASTGNRKRTSDDAPHIERLHAAAWFRGTAVVAGMDQHLRVLDSARLPAIDSVCLAHTARQVIVASKQTRTTLRQLLEMNTSTSERN